jgi:hypothetical protein
MYAGQMAALGRFQRDHKIATVDKTVRVLVTYAMVAGDEALIFGKTRCTKC